MLARVKLISEPWDVGPGGYQLGQHPPGFAEWNDRFRDGSRRFWRGDAGQRQDFAARLAGSSDIFDRSARRPWASINYAASHDGFTLADVVSYERRHNEGNGENNQDGAAENFSANWGIEGPTEDPKIRASRGRVARGMLATVMLAHGTPMLLAGDEFGRTQQGNNNAYCLDSEISWLDWQQAASPEGAWMSNFVARLLALRHEYPILRCRHFMHGKEVVAPGIADIAWFDQSGKPISVEAWNNPNERVIVLRRAELIEDNRALMLNLLLNPTNENREFFLPEPYDEARLLIDTSDPFKGEYDLHSGRLQVTPQTAILIRCMREVTP